MAAHRQPPAAVALAVLSGATALGLARVFGGRSWVVPALGAALAPHALFLLGRIRRRPAPLVAVAVTAAGALYGALIVEPSTTFSGIPTAATAAAFFRDLGRAGHVLRTAKVPVAPEGAALLLALLAVWSVAAAADWSVARRDRTLAAVMPSLVLFVALAALGSGSHVTTTAAYASAAATFLLLQNQARLVDRRAWFHGPLSRRSHVLVGGAVTAAVAVAVGLVAGPALPGARSAALLDYRALGKGGEGGAWQTVTPLVDIRARLVQDPGVELFTVKSLRPAYWRLVALDRFDGRVWGLEAEAPRVRRPLPDGESGAETVALRQRFQIGALASRWLPAAYRPVGIDLEGSRVIPGSLSLVAGGDLSDGVTYTVESEVPTPTDASLAAAGPPRTDLPADWLSLPVGFPARVRDLARDVTYGSRTPYERALALQQWFRSPDNFEYSLDVPPGHSEDALVHFLFESRRGYCEQFAGSYAAMARAIGLPARVAVGFTPGTYDSGAGLWRVTTKEAHAWPEVYLEGIGWLPFEPTPGRFEPSPGDHTGTQAENPARPGATPTSTLAPPTSSAPPPSVPDLRRLGEDGTTVNVGAPGARAPSIWARFFFAVLVVLAAGVVTGAAVGATVLALKALRRARRRAAADARARVTGAWDEALDRLAEAGIRRRPSATPVEFALRHAPAHGAGEAGPPLMALAHLETAALYAREAPDDADAGRAWEEVARLEVALHAAIPAGERWRRRLDPRTLRRLTTPRSS